jgi:RecA/RadA recombinase
MSSIREQITQYVVAVAQVPGVAANGVYRDRETAIQRQEGVVVVVQEETEQTINQNATVVVRDLTEKILLIVRSDTPSATADLIIVPLHAALTKDQTLGGLANRIIEEGTEWTYADADLPATEVSIKYRIRYMTSTQALDSLA